MKMSEPHDLDRSSAAHSDTTVSGIGVVFGAGSVGRGFIGQLLCEAGWQVIFVDLDEDLVSRLNQDGGYTHVTVSRDGEFRTRIAPVVAISARDQLGINDAVFEADLVVSCVGAGALGGVVASLAPGLLDRILAERPPLNILLAENFNQVAHFFGDLVAQRLPEIAPAVLSGSIGLVETSIGRMIPQVAPSLRAEDPTIVLAEPYRVLPFDNAAWLGQPAKIPGLIADPEVDFDFYVERKLQVHNLGHLLCGLLAPGIGTDLIAQAISHPVISAITRSAMVESATALAVKYGASRSDLIVHVDDLLDRFNNPALGDTAARVTRDLGRKMAPNDRMLGALRTASKFGIWAPHICLGVALGAHELARARGLSPEETQIWLAGSLVEAGIIVDERTRSLIRRQMEHLGSVGLDLAAQAELAADS